MFLSLFMYSFVRLVSIKGMVFWNVMQCSSVGRYPLCKMNVAVKVFKSKTDVSIQLVL
jgi:hypothetical protein